MILEAKLECSLNFFIKTDLPFSALLGFHDLKNSLDSLCKAYLVFVIVIIITFVFVVLFNFLLQVQKSSSQKF